MARYLCGPAEEHIDSIQQEKQHEFGANRRAPSCGNPARALIAIARAKRHLLSCTWARGSRCFGHRCVLGVAEVPNAFFQPTV